MYVARWVLFFITAIVLSCGKTDGIAPSDLASEPDATLPVSGSVHGRVTDSLTGLAIANAAVAILTGGTPVTSATTDSSGNYTFETVNNGSYTMSFTAQGYVSISNSALMVAGAAVNRNMSMSPPTLTGQIRVVLSWYAEDENVPNIARDLDAYLLNTSENTSTDYNNTTITWLDGSSGELDQDSTNFAGPETITLTNLSSTSNYRYFIHNYSNSDDCTALGASGAHVDVYSGSSLLKSYDLNASAGSGTIYEFFSIQNGQIVDVGQFDETLPIVGAGTFPACIP